MRLHGLSINNELDGAIVRLGEGLERTTGCNVGDENWRSGIAGADLTLAASPWHTTEAMVRLQRDQAVSKLAKFALGAPTAHWEVATPVKELVVGFWDGRKFVGEFFKIVRLNHPLAGGRGKTESNVIHGLGLRPIGALTLPDNLGSALATTSYRGPVQISRGQVAATMPAELLALMMEILAPVDRFDWLYDLACGRGRPLLSRSVMGLRVTSPEPIEGAEKHCWRMGDAWFATSYGDAPREAAKRLEKVLGGFPASAEYRVDGPTLLKERLNG